MQILSKVKLFATSKGYATRERFLSEFAKIHQIYKKSRDGVFKEIVIAL